MCFFMFLLKIEHFKRMFYVLMTAKSLNNVSSYHFYRINLL